MTRFTHYGCGIDCVQDTKGATSRMLNHLIAELTLTGNLQQDVAVFLTHHGCPKTAGHCVAVATEARRLAARFGEDETPAYMAGLLHDVSAIFPPPKRAEIAHQLGVAVLPEEETFPMIIHQKLSVVVSRECFGVTDEAVLSAIGCHTTLKSGASRLDKVVFVADKIAWDQPGTPPYLEELLGGLTHSLDAGVLVYLQHLWDQRETLKVVHPWFVAAYHHQISTRDGA